MKNILAAVIVLTLNCFKSMGEIVIVCGESNSRCRGTALNRGSCIHDRTCIENLDDNFLRKDENLGTEEENIELPDEYEPTSQFNDHES